MSQSLGDAFVEANAQPPRKQIITVYVHGSKVSNWEQAKELGLSEEASRNFAYTACEVQLTYELDRDNGNTELLAVDGCTLGPPL